MKTTFLTALAALGLATGGDDLTLRCEAGDEITRSFHYSSESELEEMMMLVDGEEMPMPGDMEQEAATELELVVRDEIEEVDDGRATRFTRTYERISGHDSMHMSDPMGEEHGQEIDQVSDLEGCAVLFGEEGGDLSPSFPEEENADEELLEGLTALLDLEGLLPEDSVEEGDSWEVDPDVIAALANPGGDLHLRAEGVGDEGFMMFGDAPGSDEEMVETDGEVVATYLGIREEDGRRLAAVEISVDYAVLVDLTDVFGGMDGDLPDDVPEGMIMPEIEHAEEETSREGEGLLLWDLERGTLHSLELSCEFTETQTISMLMSMGDMEQSMEQIMVMRGTETYEVRFDE